MADPKQRPTSGFQTALLALGVILVCTVLVMVLPTPTQPTQRVQATRPAAPTTYQVTYRVTGFERGEGSITYTNAGGDTEMRGKESFPWEKSFSATVGTFVYVSVQNARDYGNVKCEILLNGKVVKESESSGGHVIASCSGRL